MSYRIVIVEDEPLVAKDLVKLVKRLDESIHIDAVLDSVEHSLEWFPSNPAPDLVFADIQLSDGVSFDIFKKLELNIPVIFTTAYDEYAIRAFKVNGIDYLLKPVDESELTSSWKKFLRLKQDSMPFAERIKEFLNDLGSGRKKFKERFSVHSGKQVISVNASQIAMFIREEIIFLINHEGERFICDYNSLEQIEELLDPSLFFRANRQAIINLAAILGYRQAINGKIDVKLRSGGTEEITVSREKASQFKAWFDA